MISREEQKRQALEKIEEALTQLWSANLCLWSHKNREKILEAWNKAFDVKEILESELEKNKEVKEMKDKIIYDREARMMFNRIKRMIMYYDIIKKK